MILTLTAQLGAPEHLGGGVTSNGVWLASGPNTSPKKHCHMMRIPV